MPARAETLPIRETEKIPETFWGKVERNWEKGNFPCVGLDSDWSKLPPEYKQMGREEGTFQFNKEIINATHDLVCAYKPNVAFYLGTPEGVKALKRTIDYSHEKYPEIPVLADSKAGEVGNSSEAWAGLLFDDLGFDGTTINPYIGHESLMPFLKRKEKGVVVVCRTSNPGAGDFQDLSIPIQNYTKDYSELRELVDITGKTEVPLYMTVAHTVSRHWNENGNCALVVGATYPDEAEQIREMDPHIPYLVPGIGEQAGNLQQAVASSMDINKKGMIINSSRGIIFAKRERQPDGSLESVGQAARRETLKLREEINYYRENPEGFTETQKELAKVLLNEGVVKFGSFVLASGKESPIYIDVRDIGRSAETEKQLLLAKAYFDLIKAKDLKFDVFCDIPNSVSPIVKLLSHVTNIPMITATPEKKHGTGKRVYGKYQEGSTVALVVDDVSTRGTNSIPVIEQLRRAGITVKDMVVLVDREQGGPKAIKDATDCNVYSVYRLSNLVRNLRRSPGFDDSEFGIEYNKYRRTMAYLKTQK